MENRVYGVGVNDSTLQVHQSKKKLPEYRLWCKMLERCYSDKYHQSHPTYKRCEVEPFLLSFTNFYNFVRSLKGFGEVDEKGRPFQMDKDILVKGNKTYGVDTICFVPQEINLFLINAKLIRGELPVGVTYCEVIGKYRSRMMVFSKKKHIGYFSSAEEAFTAYKVAKERHAQVLAEKWKDKIDPRVYNALINYEVSIDD